MPGSERWGSRSSMRTSQWPACARASSRLAAAVTSEPKCSGPLGEGAKRPILGADSRLREDPRVSPAAGRCMPDPCCALAVAVVALPVLALAALAPLLGFDAQGRHRPRLQALDA